jgi:hypothetical protein
MNADLKELYLFNHVILLEIYDMMNNRLESVAYYDLNKKYEYCTFNLKGELILNRFRSIYIYSMQTKNTTWKCKRTYRIPDYFRCISTSIYDKLYLFSNNSIYEWNLITEKGIKILGVDVDETKYKDKVMSYVNNIFMINYYLPICDLSSSLKTISKRMSEL